MNFDNPIAALFPGAAGRTVSELTRRHLLGEESAPTPDVAAGAAVAPEQFVKVATRLAMMGLVRFPVRDEVTMVRENVMWAALADLLYPDAHLDVLVREAVSDIAGVESVVIGGPVPAGTAQSFPEGIAVALVVPHGDVPEESRSAASQKVSNGLGNDCSMVVVRTVDEASEHVPEAGRRVLHADA
ncbi:hypothetical protein [Dietzia alimentaria]|uniref:hypothetical protein n=1 Tax=Dietzia alimentaria TaxID=665550 RepID=UPI00029A4147|nr:hypothetical protein [Dietzia alimentaria]